MLVTIQAARIDQDQLKNASLPVLLDLHNMLLALGAGFEEHCVGFRCVIAGQRLASLADALAVRFRLEVGAIAVAIAVAAPHRAQAFDACRWLIDALKQRVPIWKQEWYADGSEWISDRP